MIPNASELALSDPLALGYCPVGVDATLGIARQQTNLSRRDGGIRRFVVRYKEFKWSRRIFKAAIQRLLIGGYSMLHGL